VRLCNKKLFSLSGRNQLSFHLRCSMSHVRLEERKNPCGECTVLHLSNTDCLCIPEKLHGVVGHLSVVKLYMMCYEWFTVVPDRLPLRIQPKMAEALQVKTRLFLAFSILQPNSSGPLRCVLHCRGFLTRSLD
jgi:hypothetical protein